MSGFSELDSVSNRYVLNKDSSSDILVSHFQTWEGMCQLAKLVNDALKWTKVLAKYVKLDKGIVEIFVRDIIALNFILKYIKILKILMGFGKLKKSYGKYKNGNENFENLLRNIFFTAAEGCVLFKLGEVIRFGAKGDPIFDTVMNLNYIGSSVISLKQEAGKCERIKENTNDEANSIILKESKRLSMIKMATSIAYIALSVFFIIESFFENTFSSIFFLMVKTITTILLPMASSLYGKSLTYKRIEE